MQKKSAREITAFKCVLLQLLSQVAARCMQVPSTNHGLLKTYPVFGIDRVLLYMFLVKKLKDNIDYYVCTNQMPTFHEIDIGSSEVN